MYFNRTKALTGLMSFTMAAAIAGTPMNAMGMAVHPDRKVKGFRSSYSVTPQNAQAELVSGAVDSLARTGSDKFFLTARLNDLQKVVGKTFLTTGGTEFAVAAPNAYVNIHADASLGSDIVGKMYSNDVAKVLQKNSSGWARVESGKVVGYVLTDYLVEGDEARMILDLVGNEVSPENSENGAADSDNGKETDQSDSAENESETSTTVYPVAESAEEIEERKENETVKEAADKAQEKAAAAADVAEAAQQRAQKAQDDVDDSSVKTTEADEKEAEAAKSVAEITQKAAEAAQESADEAREEMQNHGAESGKAVAEFALQFVGNPYVWGGSSLTNGTDCSGFTMAVYANFGVSLPHYDASQRSYGIAIDSLSDARAGDLICYYGHVGIYIGDGMIVHAANARDGIKVSRADYRQIAAIRRIFY